MMHRYLFRGKRLDSSKWVHGFLMAPINRPHTDLHILPLSTKTEKYCRNYYEIDPATIGQCTGLSAKKSYRGECPEDLLIFEGDIVKGSYEETDGRIVYYFEEVKYITEQGGWILGDEDAFNNLDGISAQEVEVVGNVHDNREFLDVLDVSEMPGM